MFRSPFSWLGSSKTSSEPNRCEGLDWWVWIFRFRIDYPLFCMVAEHFGSSPGSQIGNRSIQRLPDPRIHCNRKRGGGLYARSLGLGGQPSFQVLTQSLQSLKTKPGVVDKKGIGKPEVLKATYEEAAQVWKLWSFKFETWFKADHPATADNVLDSASADIDSMDAHLHLALAYNRGSDAWRRLCYTYEPRNNRTSVRLLRHILSPPRATVTTLRSGVDRFESNLAEYESKGQPKPSDETLSAILLIMVPENLEEHLELNIQRFDHTSRCDQKLSTKRRQENVQVSIEKERESRGVNRQVKRK